MADRLAHYATLRWSMIGPAATENADALNLVRKPVNWHNKLVPV